MVCNHCWETETKQANKLFHMQCFREASVIYLKLFNAYLNLERIEEKASADELMLHIDRFIITANNIIECARALDSMTQINDFVALVRESIKALINRKPNMSEDNLNRLALRLKTAESLKLESTTQVISQSYDDSSFAVNSMYQI